MRMQRTRRWRLGLLMAAIGLSLGMGRGLAQEGTPAGEEHLVAHHPAHLHQGDCASPSPEPAYTLTEVEMDLEAMGQGPAIPVEIATTTIDATLADLLAGPYAIDIHEIREFDEETIVACGDLGGQPVGDTLAVGVREQNGSAFSGIAVLQAVGEQTAVTLYLAHGLSEAHEGEDREATQATVAFHVPTITCPGCQLRVEASLAQVPGVLDVQIEGQDVAVTYDPSQVSPDQIQEALEAGGDTVEPLGA